MGRRRRKRRTSRRSKRDSRQIAFRVGRINAAGGRPVVTQSRTLKSVTCGQLVCTGATCGDESTFAIGDWSAPADPETGGTFTLAGTANNHPSGHVELVADGFDTVMVLSSMYRFNVRFVGDDNEGQDFVFAYRFSVNSTNILTHTAGAIGIDNFKDMRQSRGWVWKRMSATHSGGSVHPSAQQFQVRIPNVKKLIKKFNDDDITDITYKDYRHVLTDAAATCAVNAFLHICVMTIDGVALTAGDIHIDVDVFQKVRVWKNPGEFQIERADQET